MAIKNPHDALVKHTFSQPAYAADLIRCMLPDDLLAAIDFDTLAPCPGSFIDDALRDTHTDLLFSADLAGESAYLYLLIEHQSTVDRWMPVRIWWTLGDIWRQHVKQHPDAERLPLVIPMVLHHSTGGWTAPTGIGELLAAGAAVRQALGEHLPRLRFYLEDLGTRADEELMARSMAALPRLALWALKNARSESDLVAEMAAWRRVFRDVLDADNGVRALAAILRYILQVNQAEPEAIEAFVTELGEDASEAYMTGAQILEQRGRENAYRQMLQTQLRQRFGAVPEAVTARIARADSDQLQRWVERVVVADTLEDVLS